ncbi:hypothetical protein BDW59DRAFT_135488 [Aspergillus cavernicola]|uniref:C3H1-type domain-containing protein n=1 Tax=Aspergillus cavernicola TaxID=176166 RepID=A0ABR4HMW7_9EURO
MESSASHNAPSQPSAHPVRQNRLSTDMKSRAPLPVSSGPQNLQNGHSRNPSGYDMAARSPPNQSNTKHVPCKFFRQGACQAGPACPFLHSSDASTEYAACKYFSKGNCKFGAKCALAHILPDGRRVNRPNPGGMGMGSGHLNLGGRVNPQAYVNQDSALTNSVLSQQRMNGHDPRYVSQLPSQEEFAALHPQQQPPYDIPSIDTGLASDAGSKYGSPVEELRFPLSPNHNNQYLTTLDAPLPASFDSQGISHAARYGPVAASMPSRFGLESPAQRANPPTDALRNLRDAAYGNEVKKPSSSFIGSSPPGMLEDGLGSRFLHSQRPVKPRMLSASVPRPMALDDWEDGNFPMEEDYLPMNLHDDVLTPQERLRRLSRTDHELSSSHRDLSGLGMSGTSFSKVNSPLASSPSRFGALFAKQRQKKEEEAHGSFTHFGSPLRESSMNFGSPNLGPIGSPPRQTATSMISQQLGGLSLHPSSARHTPSVGASSRLDRTVSSPVNTSKIEEEQGEGDLVFSMEEEENNKRNSNEESTSVKASDLRA